MHAKPPIHESDKTICVYEHLLKSVEPFIRSNPVQMAKSKNHTNHNQSEYRNIELQPLNAQSLTTYRYDRQQGSP